MTRLLLSGLGAALLVLATAPLMPSGAHAAGGDDARADLLARYAAEAGADFPGFSAERGRALFMGPHAGGKPETPACATCHTPDPRAMGRHYRTGRDILPMAVSANPDRFTDTADVEKRFGRDCPNVLGRACTPLEKGDFITYLSGE
ncbi:MAG: DUF1924 domain-containing protein [Zavarzinia sp.]|nr:DUF1924 domain-containing protein [Zavarzinia sp.]